MSDNREFKESISRFFEDAKVPLISSAALAAIILPVSIYFDVSAGEAKEGVLDDIAAECSAYQDQFSQLYSQDPDAALQKLINDGGQIETVKSADGYGLTESYKIASTTVNPSLSKIIEDLYENHLHKYNRGEMKLDSTQTECVLSTGP
jgi:hypothetical protein